MMRERSKRSPFLKLHDEALVLLRLAEAVDARHRGDDDHVAALEQRARRGVAQLVDLVVDVGVLGDVGVGARDVRLGLVVVVVRDEVLDGVLGEELLELGAELRGQRAVRRQHERRALIALDDVGHREGLAGAGDAEQRLRPFALLQSADERLDGLGLVAGGLEVGDKLELLRPLVAPPLDTGGGGGGRGGPPRRGAGRACRGFLGGFVGPGRGANDARCRDRAQPRNGEDHGEPAGHRALIGAAAGARELLARAWRATD